MSSRRIVAVVVRQRELIALPTRHWRKCGAPVSVARGWHQAEPRCRPACCITIEQELESPREARIACDERGLCGRVARGNVVEHEYGIAGVLVCGNPFSCRGCLQHFLARPYLFAQVPKLGNDRIRISFRGSMIALMQWSVTAGMNGFLTMSPG